MHDKIALIPAQSISVYRDFLSWKKGALAITAALTLLGIHLNADALGLGAVRVQSFLGEPLRAEVEVPDITSEEASAFQATLGTPQEFQAAGVNYNQALRGTRITLSRRANGQAYLRVQGQQPVNEPFLSIVIDASSGSNHVVRDYTLLIDPPHQSAAASAPPPGQRESAPVITGAPRRGSSAFSGAASQPSGMPGASSASGEGEQVRVQRGDTATAILDGHQIDGVSLDQMLVALLRANPQAFIHGNVNLIRAGAIVNLPSADQAAAVSPGSARRTLIAQSHDFRAYRQGLAKTAARGHQMAASPRSAAGNVQPQVQETNAAPASPDRLKLSRGHSAGQTQKSAGRAETGVAQSRHAQEQAAREAELRRNISELSQLAGASASAAAASAAKPSTPAINIPASSAVAAATATAQTAAASAPATAASAPPRPAAPRLPPEPSFLDTLLDNGSTLAGVAALVLLVGGYLFYRTRRKKNSYQAKLDSGPISESKLPSDSYFGASGGQRVDTSNDTSTSSSGNADTGSSLAYSSSQLEAVGDIDPVSEADVYLAYGRDAQAEEILKEALRTYPGRPSIYVKLAEIYAKQRDASQLTAIATEARRITHGEGHDWQAIADLGKALDPTNPLYAPASAPAAKTPPAMQQPASSRPGSPGTQDVDDLDLAGMTMPPQPSGGFSQTVLTSMPTPLSTAATEPLPLVAQRSNTVSAPGHTYNIDFRPPAPSSPRAQPGNSGIMEFDANVLPGSSASRPAQAQLDASKQPNEDSLATKLALAQEFRAIGDTSSARSLIKEVLAEATGPLKAKAEQFLSDLG
jgi:pilus assembly protein FimV